MRQYARTRTQPKRDGSMNRMEREWALVLEARRRAGQIARWDFQPVKLRLADRTARCGKIGLHSTDYKRGTYAAAGIIALLVVLCVLASLSGCLTPAVLAEMAQRADTLSRGAKTDECADAAANAASAVVVALEDMTRATRLSDPVRSPKSALRLAEVACLECVRDTDCAADQECVGGHCQKRRK